MSLRFTGNGSLVLLAATVVVSALIEAAKPEPILVAGMAVSRVAEGS
jgi:hypothetical protein